MRISRFNYNEYRPIFIKSEVIAIDTNQKENKGNMLM
jgi:hypothetical protein